MAERVRIRGGEWPLIVLIAIAVAVPTAFAPLLTLAAAALAIVLGLVVFNASALLLLMVAAFPWDDMLGYPTETISVIKLLGALLLIGYALRSLARDEEVRLPPTTPALVIFTMLVLLSLMVSGDIAEGLSKTLRYLLFAAFSFLVVQLVQTRAQIVNVIRVLVLSSTAAALYGVVLLLKGDVDRVSGPIGEANDFAYLLASVLPFAVYLSARDRRTRAWWIVCCGVLILALLGTLSRGALVGLAAVVLWAVATRRTRLGGVVAGTFVVAGVLGLAFTLWHPLIDERLAAKSKVATANVESRKAYWDAALAMTADHPLLGVGPGRYGVEAREYVHNDPLNLENPVVHNAYLEVLAEGGIPTLLAFLAFIGGSWMLAARARRRFQAAEDADGLRITAAVQASLVVAIVSASFLSVQTSVPLWLLGGLAGVLALSK
ncbi:MAG TPA: O-antigen ligase family protein [Solirubrobacter sp.]|nr:O-antigen ligase family protein [Solirubrobacter sp.]